MDLKSAARTPSGVSADFAMQVATYRLIAAALAELLAFLALYMKANEIFVDSAKSLFG